MRPIKGEKSLAPNAARLRDSGDCSAPGKKCLSCLAEPSRLLEEGFFQVAWFFGSPTRFFAGSLCLQMKGLGLQMLLLSSQPIRVGLEFFWPGIQRE